MPPVAAQPPPAQAVELPAVTFPEASKWFADEVHPHDAALKAYLRHSFPAVRDVEDVVQESYLEVWRSRATQPIRSARAFLFTVARHLALNLVARERSAPVVGVANLRKLDVAAESPDAAEATARSETRRLLVEALATLPPRCREITLLRKIEGMPQKEIAARLGVAEKTVEEQVARGVRRCETYLRRRGVTRYLGS